ncbi:MAG: hypothetical protein F6K42_11155 [Leptolyngbya sp. SIO1D8]|nr:hypothetical protein [Leptolyngbya sp. SIO1D8]
MEFQEESHSKKSRFLPLAGQNISMEVQEKITGGNGIQMKITDNQRNLKATEVEKSVLISVDPYPDR